MEIDNEVTEEITEEPREIASLDELKALANEEPVESEPAPQAVEESTEPEYIPNYSYKVKDEELEFDEILRTAVTSKEAEERLRDLHTRAAGLDSYKTKYTDLEGKYGNVESQAQKLVGAFNTLKELRDKKDWNGLTEAIGLTPDLVTDWALALDDHQQLPEEQRQMIEQNRQMQAQLAQMQNQMTDYQSMGQEQRIEQEVNELKSLVSSEAYSPVSQAMSEKGLNMTDIILDHGHKIYRQTGQEPSIKEVVDQVAQQYNFLLTTQPVQEQGLPQVNPVQAPPVQQQTLPSVTGSNTAATGEVMTLDKLKQLANNIG